MLDQFLPVRDIWGVGVTYGCRSLVTFTHKKPGRSYRAFINMVTEAGYVQRLLVLEYRCNRSIDLTPQDMVLSNSNVRRKAPGLVVLSLEEKLKLRSLELLGHILSLLAERPSCCKLLSKADKSLWIDCGAVYDHLV